MALIGILNTFDNQKEPWDQYAERLKAYFTVNKLTDPDTQKAILQTVLSPETYSLLRSRIRPATIESKTYDELVAALTQHFNPEPQRSVSRLRFRRRLRKTGESVETYLADLQHLVLACKYSESDEMIVDQIIFGINSDAMQQRLIAEETEKNTITLERATKLLLAMESSARNLTEMKAEDKTAQVNRINGKNNLRDKNTNRPNKNRSNNATGGSNAQRSQQKGSEGEGKPATNTDRCMRCTSSDHKNSACPFVHSKCHKCNRTGHIAKACFIPPGKPKPHRGRKPPNQSNHIGATDSVLDEYDIHAYSITEAEAPTPKHEHAKEPAVNAVNSYQPIDEEVPPPDIVTMEVNGVPVSFEIDNGSGYTMIKEADFKTLPPDSPIQPFSRKLESYTGDAVRIVGQATVKVTYGNIRATLPLIIVRGTRTNLCGRKWLYSRLNILISVNRNSSVSVNTIQYGDADLDSILAKRSNLFTPGLGKLAGIRAHLHIKELATPRFCKARTVPYARKETVENELRRMVKEGILTKVDYADYASPIVSVQKPNGGIRICADFKTTLNPQLNVDQYPLPRAEDIFAKLAGCVYFSTLDLKEAYNQIELDEASRKYTVINTSLGLFQFNRLPFGVASASAIFQRVMETILSDITQVSPFQDDTLIGGQNREDHLTILDAVLCKLEHYGLKLKLEKCKFLQTEVEFLGHRLDKQGIHPQAKKMTAIVEAPEPKNVETLRSFLGLLNYYAKFLPNNATKLAPLYELLKKNKDWSWGKEQAKAFQVAKTTLLTSNILTHYDVKKPISLACDASPVGVGAVISHHEGTFEQPISFASRSLAPAEKNYSQLDKEALAIIFGLKKFKDYLYGKKFTLYTDHQPLVTLLGATKPIPPMAAARLQRWALLMAAYSYELVFRKGSANANADALSRSPLPTSTNNTAAPAEYVFLVKDITAHGPLTARQLEDATHSDPTLQQVWHYMLHGWPCKNIPTELEPFHKRRNELSNFNGILLLGNRVIVPSGKRTDMLKDLHSSHQGIIKMKAVARSRIWWPHIDRDIENITKACHICQEHASMPPTKYQPWPVTTTPWDRVHANFAGPVDGMYLLVVVDSHSKWIEVAVTKSQTSLAVISFLRQLIARFGIMLTLVTDNGTCFSSSEFSEFTRKNGITHLRSAPHHPASNGTAERGVRTIKEKLKKISENTFEAGDILHTGLASNSSGSLEDRIARILMNHRRSPTSSGKSPAELMLGRPIVSRLDLCHPDIVASRPLSEVPSKPKFQPNDRVYVRNFGKGENWFIGTISSALGHMMYTIQTPQGEVRRHANQMRPRMEDNSIENFRTSLDTPSVPSQPWYPTTSLETDNNDTPSRTQTTNNQELSSRGTTETNKSPICKTTAGEHTTPRRTTTPPCTASAKPSMTQARMDVIQNPVVNTSPRTTPTTKNPLKASGNPADASIAKTKGRRQKKVPTRYADS